MAVSTRLTELLTSCGAAPLSESLQLVQRTCGDLDEFVHGIIGELESLYGELDEQRQAWRAEQAQARASQALVVEPEVDESAWVERLQAVEQERDELARARAAVQAELDAATARVAKLATVAVGAADAKAETASLKAELAETKGTLASVQAELFRQQQRGATDDEAVWQKQIDEAVRERDLVEVQFEAMRDRVAELTEQCEQQGHQFAEERRQWQSELAELRRLVTAQARSTANQAGSLSDTLTENPRHSTVIRRTSVPDAAPTSGPNPVVDSVMAQFQMVQREAARRRQKAG